MRVNAAVHSQLLLGLLQVSGGSPRLVDKTIAEQQACQVAPGRMNEMAVVESVHW